jgi:hypothetical protein
MAAQNPLIIGEDTLLPDVWIKIAIAIQSGLIHILKGDLVYYETHRLTGETAPDDLILPDDPLFEGVPVYYRNERIAGETVPLGGSSVSSTVPRDIYIYSKSLPGRIRLDVGDV